MESEIIQHSVDVGLHGGASGAVLSKVATVVSDAKLVPETTRREVPRLTSNQHGFRAMTFNLRFDTERDGTNRWCFRNHLAAAVVLHHSPDVIGFQEALRKQIKDLEASLPEYGWAGVGRDDGKEAGEFCPVFWRKSKFRSIDSGTFWLSQTPDVAGSRGWGARCRRIATWVRLVTLDEKEDQLFFLNCHFDHEQEQARQESSLLLSRHIPKLITESNQRLSSNVIPPVVIVGDLNAEENTPTLRILRGEERLYPEEDHNNALTFKDARIVAKQKYNGNDGSFTDWSPPTRTQDAKKVILIDHLLHHGDLEPVQYGIICELWQGRRASDHRPLVVDYSFETSTR